jgi:hypothetical protein
MPLHRDVDASKADSPHPLIAWHEAKTKPAELNSIRRLQIDAAEGIFRSFSVAPKAWVCKTPKIAAANRGSKRPASRVEARPCGQVTPPPTLRNILDTFAPFAHRQT